MMKTRQWILSIETSVASCSAKVLVDDMLTMMKMNAFQ